MEFKGIIRKEKSTKKRIFLFVGSVFLAGFSFMQHEYLYTFLAILLAVLCAFKKEHVVSEEGVDIRYDLLGIKHVHRWEWHEITAMRPDYKKARPNIFLEIAKDVTIRAFIYTEEDAFKVMALAKKMNPDAYIDDRTEEEREQYERDRDEIIEEQKRRHRAQKQAERVRRQKNKKKKK